MFGSKIRSWMENHIVRPRKKGNKNKNANSNVAANGGLANGQKAIPSHGESSIGCSSARRSEVSPIQNHTTSRFGWQSPQDDYHCPNATDGNYSYHVKSTTTSPKTIHRYNNLSNGGGTAAGNDSPRHSLNQSQYSKSVDAKYLTRTYEENVGKIRYDEQRPTYQLQNKDILPGILKSSTSSGGAAAKSTETMSKPTINFAIDSPISSPYRQRSNPNRRHDEVYNGVEHREQNAYDDRYQYNGNQRVINQSPQMYSNGGERQGADDVHVKRGIYGKIMNGKCLNGNHRDDSHSGGNKRTDRPIPMLPPPPSTPPPPQNDKYFSYGRYNDFHSNGGAGQIPQFRKSIDNPYDVPSDAFYAPKEMTVSPRDLHQKRVFGVNGVRTTPSPQQNQAQHHQQHTHQHKVQFMNGTHVSASSGSHHPLAHVIMNSLSSPESAYSTGYSTDGTSPGTSNAPEYYINMRTGTHYFPRGVAGVAAVERNCQKFGLNKIEETASETTTTTTTTATAMTILSNHRRTESCDLGKSKLKTATALVPPSTNDTKTSVIAMRAMSPDVQRRLAYPNYRGFESPSPRQRCRIRTNPWVSIADGGSNSAMTVAPKNMDCETGSTSSGVKSNSDVGIDEKNWLPNGKNLVLSESDSSTSTEIEMIRKSFSPRRRRLDKQMSECLPSATLADSEDEDATFNELMGKFDESYVYEKETDILSDDSDPTECASEFDTGLDGGDECDIDEMPDINYIDTESIQEICDKDAYQNTGSCTYHQLQTDRLQSKLRKRGDAAQSSRRKKRLTRTRKRNSECRERDNSLASSKTISPSRSRGSRSVGGTPMSLRRNQKEKQASRFLAIAESEKAILKADIEADVKYKQLIHEAETILVSMKTTALRETPVPSPSRRTCSVPPNKRVEMLRTCEVDLRRELSKSGKCDESPKKEPPQIEVPSIPSSPTFNHGANAAARCSPRKTHLTNFMHQNDVNPRHLRVNEPHSPERHYEMKRSPGLLFDGLKFSPPKSPMPRRRFRSQSPRFFIEESDTESESAIPKPTNAFGARNKENKLRNSVKKARPQPIASPKRNVNKSNIGKLDAQVFRAIEISSSPDAASYCPQSEPLKRKIYSEKTLDRLQKSLEVDAEVPRQELLQKISILRRERQQSVATSSTRSYSIEGCNGMSGTHNESYQINEVVDKRLLILNTIEDLKRNLEEQSIELYDLNGDE